MSEATNTGRFVSLFPDYDNDMPSIFINTNDETREND